MSAFCAFTCFRGYPRSCSPISKNHVFQLKMMPLTCHKVIPWLHWEISIMYRSAVCRYFGKLCSDLFDAPALDRVKSQRPPGKQVLDIKRRLAEENGRANAPGS